MKYIEIVASSGSADTVAAIAEKVKAEDFRLGLSGEDGMQQMRMLVADGQVQEALDTLQHVLGAQPTARLTVLNVEAVLPKPPEEPDAAAKQTTMAREALYEEVSKGARSGSDFYLLVALSTLVAGIGLIENNVAVLIGAMVIAPLLGPNLALSLGTALADVPLMRRSAVTLLQGIVLAVTLSALLGLAWPGDVYSQELLARTVASWDSVVLALASGAAAALSLTTGLSSVLVGVMVAVALLPPAAAVGLMLGQGNTDLAVGAFLLLAINVVCVNLASKLVFLARDISPRTWLEKEKARSVMKIYVFAWLLILAVLMTAIIARSRLVG